MCYLYEIKLPFFTTLWIWLGWCYIIQSMFLFLNLTTILAYKPVNTGEGGKDGKGSDGNNNNNNSSSNGESANHAGVEKPISGYNPARQQLENAQEVSSYIT